MIRYRLRAIAAIAHVAEHRSSLPLAAVYFRRRAPVYHEPRRFRFASGVGRVGLLPRRILGMRLFDIARIAALISCVALLSACPKKDTDATPEPGAPAAQAP